MNFKQKIKNIPVLYGLILAVLNMLNYFNIRFHLKFPKYKLTDYWAKRIEKVMASPDNQRIRHVKDAGNIFNDYQLMHNNVKITLGSYYDYGNTQLLQQNKGVHEPQEEFVFQELLPYLKEGSTMMELGSYWAFYSLWFASVVKNAKCYMVEPDPHKMNFGKLNFKLNNLNGVFCLGFIDGHTNTKKSIPVLHVDELMRRFELNFLTILHSDIQGYELNMLKGSEISLSEKKIGYLFISTHSNQLHEDCLSLLKKYNYVILCEANLDESYSVDGLIVAKLPSMPGLSTIDISKRR